MKSLNRRIIIKNANGIATNVTVKKMKKCNPEYALFGDLDGRKQIKLAVGTEAYCKKVKKELDTTRNLYEAIEIEIAVSDMFR